MGNLKYLWRLIRSIVGYENFFCNDGRLYHPIKHQKKAFYCLYLHFYAFLEGEIPYILIFEYNIFRHTSYFKFDGTAK
jgi:hypothetical protein